MEAIFAVLAASLVSFAVLYLLLERRIRKRVDPETILGQIRREIEGLIVDLNQTAERALSLLEEKMNAAKDVVEKSERRVAALRREAKSLERAGKAYIALKDAPMGRPEPPAKKAGPSRGKRATPAERETAPVKVEGPTEGLPVRHRIVSLHRAGFSVDSIVNRLGVPRATVDLVVSLEDQGSLQDAASLKDTGAMKDQRAEGGP